LLFPPAFFITGTDTDVGKSVVAAILTLGLKAAYWKPVQSGNEPSTDTDWIKSATELDNRHFFSERYRLTNPLSPHEAARLDNIQISLHDFALPDSQGFPHLVIEGAGGLMVPLNESDLMIDLLQQFAVPALLVSRSTLGTINHTLLSLQQLRQRNIPVLGVIMNGPRNPANKQAIEHFGQVPVIAEIEPLAHIDAATLQDTFQKSFLQHQVI